MTWVYCDRRCFISQLSSWNWRYSKCSNVLVSSRVIINHVLSSFNCQYRWSNFEFRFAFKSIAFLMFLALKCKNLISSQRGETALVVREWTKSTQWPSIKIWMPSKVRILTTVGNYYYVAAYIFSYRVAFRLVFELQWAKNIQYVVFFELCTTYVLHSYGYDFIWACSLRWRS